MTLLNCLVVYLVLACLFQWLLTTLICIAYHVLVVWCLLRYYSLWFLLFLLWESVGLTRVLNWIVVGSLERIPTKLIVNKYFEQCLSLGYFSDYDVLGESFYSDYIVCGIGGRSEDANSDQVGQPKANWDLNQGFRIENSDLFWTRLWYWWNPTKVSSVGRCIRTQGLVLQQPLCKTTRSCEQDSAQL